MKNVIALAASNSRSSINRQLIDYVASRLEGAHVNVMDLNDIELPLYSPQIEQEKGIPAAARRFDEWGRAVDGWALSLAEHNGMYTAAFKNTIDWVSRIDRNIWKKKPMLLMAASPGSRGGASVLQLARHAFPRFGGHIVAEFSLPFFEKNFSEEGLRDAALHSALLEQISLFQEAL